MWGIVWSLLAAGFGLQEISSKVRVAVKSEASFSEVVRSRVVRQEDLSLSASAQEESVHAGHASGPDSTCKRWNAGARAHWANGDDWGTGGPAICSPTLTNDPALDRKLQCIQQQHTMQEVGFVALDTDVTDAIELGAVHKDHRDALSQGRARGCWAEVGGGAFSSKKWKKIGHKEKAEDVKSNCIGTGRDNLFITYGKTGGEQVFSWLWLPVTADANGFGRIRYYYPKNFAYGLYRSDLDDNIIGKGMKAACWKEPGNCLDVNYCFSCTGSFCPNRDNCPGGENTPEHAWSPHQPSMTWKPCPLTTAETGDEWAKCHASSHVTLAGGAKVVLRSIKAQNDAGTRYRLQLTGIPTSSGYDGRPCFLHSILACSVSDGQPMGRMFTDPSNFGESAEMKVCGLPA